MTSKLDSYGYTESINDLLHTFDSTIDLIPGRIITAYGEDYLVMTEQGPVKAVCSGKMRYVEENTPVTGDWTAIQYVDETMSVIHGILKRRTFISRVSAGKRSADQPIAANVDTAFIVMGLDNNYRINRLQRYAALCIEGGVNPVCVLNKRDLCDDPEQKKIEVIERTGVECFCLSALTGDSVSLLQSAMESGKTYCLLGSSGAGKSTLINALSSTALQKTNDVRESDSKGRHTTTRRELFLLGNGSILIDTPGMRELKVAVSDETLASVFSSISDLASDCRFDDCTHTTEPGCAVIEALEEGKISEEEYTNYIKMKRDSDRLNAGRDLLSKMKQKQKERQFGKMVKEAGKTKKRLTGK